MHTHSTELVLWWRAKEKKEKRTPWTTWMGQEKGEKRRMTGWEKDDMSNTHIKVMQPPESMEQKHRHRAYIYTRWNIFLCLSARLSNDVCVSLDENVNTIHPLNAHGNEWRGKRNSTHNTQSNSSQLTHRIECVCVCQSNWAVALFSLFSSTRFTREDVETLISEKAEKELSKREEHPQDVKQQRINELRGNENEWLRRYIQETDLEHRLYTHAVGQGKR